MRQQAEVEVIADYLSVSKNKSRVHIDLTGAVILLVLCCNILFPKMGSNLLFCVCYKKIWFNVLPHPLKSDSVGKILFLSYWIYTQSKCEDEKPIWFF